MPRRERARPRVHRPHLVEELRSSAGEVERTVGLLQLPAVRRPALVLRHGGDASVGPRRQDARQQLTAAFKQARREGAGGVVVRDSVLLLCDDGAGVGALVQQHDADPGDGVALQDGLGDGRGAAVAGQQRWVDVQAAVACHSQQRRRQDAAVGCDDHRVGREGSEAARQSPACAATGVAGRGRRARAPRGLLAARTSPVRGQRGGQVA